MKRVALCVVLLVGMGCVADASAWQRAAAGEVPETLINGGFLDYHPDMANRGRGMQFLKDGSAEKAMEAFRRGARYADKPSQGLLGEMYWYGVDMPRDPVQAYLWMDLAAERGYPLFMELRDRYRATLTAGQLAQAEAGKPALWAEYADDVAMPRLAAELVRGKRSMTGSRTGFMGNQTTVSVPGPTGNRTIDSSEFYDEKYWDPAEYRAWQDQAWMSLPKGNVDVGIPQSVQKENEEKP